MHLLTKVLDLLHEEYDLAYETFMQDHNHNDELYDSMPDPYSCHLLTYEETYYGADDYESYQDEDLKPGTDQLKAIQDLAYDLYVDSWLLCFNDDRCVHSYYDCFVQVYALAAYFATSHNMKELQVKVETWENIKYDSLDYLKTIYIIEVECPLRGNRQHCLYSKKSFLDILKNIAAKEV